MASLILLTGSKQGKRFPILRNRITLGRQSNCDIVINSAMRKTSTGESKSVSRKQAVIAFAGEEWYIEDGDGQGEKSRNGTHVNEQKVPYPGRLRLRDQDKISFCDVIFLFQFSYFGFLV